MSSGFSRQAFVLACFLFFAAVLPTASAQTELGEEYIEQFDVDITIGQTGEIGVIETIRYHFGTTERHGIYRDIPYEYAGQYGTKRSMPVDVESVTDADGKAFRFEESRTGGYLRVKIGDPNRLVTGTVTYIIRYSVRDAVSFFPEYDELYWNVTGNGWTVPIVASAATIHLAEPVLGNRFVCYLGPVGSTERCPIVDDDTTVVRSEFRASAGRMLPAGSGLTIALGFPKGIIHEPSAFERFLSFFGDNPLVILPFAVFGFMFRRWWHVGRDPAGRGTIVPEYDVPEGLSPLHIAALQDGRLSGKEIPAAIIDLAVKGYLVIEQVTDDGLVFDTTDYRLIETAKRPAAGSIESLLLEALFTSAQSSLDTAGVRKLLAAPQAKLLPDFLKRSIEANLPKEVAATETTLRLVKISELKNKFYAKIPELQKWAVTDLVSRKLLARSPQEVWGKYALWGLLVFFVSFFILPIFQLEGINVIMLLVCIPIYIFFAYLMPRVTREGAIMKERLLGLRDYLQIAEKRRIEFHNAPEKTPELFERLLPAALLLGVSDIWAKEFADLTMAEPEWYRGGNASSFSAASLASDLGGFNTTAASSLASAPSSSGSGGGGSSGGGGGGGGGGSW
jgi:uncharacterized membrane protein YgcG